MFRRRIFPSEENSRLAVSPNSSPESIACMLNVSAAVAVLITAAVSVCTTKSRYALVVALVATITVLLSVSCASIAATALPITLDADRFREARLSTPAEDDTPRCKISDAAELTNVLTVVIALKLSKAMVDTTIGRATTVLLSINAAVALTTLSAVIVAENDNAKTSTIVALITLCALRLSVPALAALIPAVSDATRTNAVLLVIGAVAPTVAALRNNAATLIAGAETTPAPDSARFAVAMSRTPAVIVPTRTSAAVAESRVAGVTMAAKVSKAVAVAKAPAAPVASSVRAAVAVIAITMLPCAFINPDSERLAVLTDAALALIVPERTNAAVLDTEALELTVPLKIRAAMEVVGALAVAPPDSTSVASAVAGTVTVIVPSKVSAAVAVIGLGETIMLALNVRAAIALLAARTARELALNARAAALVGEAEAVSEALRANAAVEAARTMPESVADKLSAAAADAVIAAGATGASVTTHLFVRVWPFHRTVEAACAVPACPESCRVSTAFSGIGTVIGCPTSAATRVQPEAGVPPSVVPVACCAPMNDTARQLFATGVNAAIADDVTGASVVREVIASCVARATSPDTAYGPPGENVTVILALESDALTTFLKSEELTALFSEYGPSTSVQPAIVAVPVEPVPQSTTMNAMLPSVIPDGSEKLPEVVETVECASI